MICKRGSFLFVLSLAFAGCSDSSPGIMLNLDILHQDSSGDAQTGDTRVFTNNLGAEITIRTGYVVLSEAELEPCSAEARLPSWFRFLLPIQNAWAHGESTGFNLGVPIAENALSEDQKSVDWGSIAPAAGSYCELSVTVGAADEDAKNLPEDVDMVGKSYYVEGKYVPNPLVPGTFEDFEIFSSAPASVELHFHDANDVETPIELSMENLSTDVTIGTYYDKWFDDVDVTSMTPSEMRDKVLANIVASLHMHE